MAPPPVVTPVSSRESVDVHGDTQHEGLVKLLSGGTLDEADWEQIGHERVRGTFSADLVVHGRCERASGCPHDEGLRRIHVL